MPFNPDLVTTYYCGGNKAPGCALMNRLSGKERPGGKLTPL
ncbi:hypothetical protein BN137_1110 [Cronobacter condimenti 1330]|uniref:Uncharacterized protein n=1 Tax=Cronobacter condimenti 1330 TaxID=1073999 RepID=K8A7S4_9ENTR|nr:hypothetical protein BN137_1110 [Cronobacter condimenti 1330]